MLQTKGSLESGRPAASELNVSQDACRKDGHKQVAAGMETSPALICSCNFWRSWLLKSCSPFTTNVFITSRSVLLSVSFGHAQPKHPVQTSKKFSTVKLNSMHLAQVTRPSRNLQLCCKRPVPHHPLNASSGRVASRMEDERGISLFACCQPWTGSI